MPKGGSVELIQLIGNVHEDINLNDESKIIMNNNKLAGFNYKFMKNNRNGIFISII